MTIVLPVWLAWFIFPSLCGIGGALTFLFIGPSHQSGDYGFDFLNPLLKLVAVFAWTILALIGLLAYSLLR